VVRIVARPERSLALRLEPALYRLGAEGLEPVDPGRWQLERHDGTLVLSGEAGALTGGAAGTHTLYLVLARPGDPAVKLEGPASADPREHLAAGGRRRVYPLVLNLLPEPVDETTLSPGDTP
jgi:hypothetical protein